MFSILRILRSRCRTRCAQNGRKCIGFFRKSSVSALLTVPVFTALPVVRRSGHWFPPDGNRNVTKIGGKKPPINTRVLNKKKTVCESVPSGVTNGTCWRELHTGGLYVRESPAATARPTGPRFRWTSRPARCWAFRRPRTTFPRTCYYYSIKGSDRQTTTIRCKHDIAVDARTAPACRGLRCAGDNGRKHAAEGPLVRLRTSLVRARTTTAYNKTVARRPGLPPVCSAGSNATSPFGRSVFARGRPENAIRNVIIGRHSPFSIDRCAHPKTWRT